MYVTDDKAARLALETVQQLAELDQSFELVDETDFMLSGINNVDKDDACEETGTHLKNYAENKTSKKLFSIFDKTSTPTQMESQRQSMKPKKSRTITTQVKILLSLFENFKKIRSPYKLFYLLNILMFRLDVTGLLK